MEFYVALRLIKGGIDKVESKQTWADLGAGSGLFTNALATILKEGSTLYAIDKDSKALDKIRIESDQVTLKKTRKDFIHEELGMEPVDGILMANSIHFVADKLSFMQRLKVNLKPLGRLILVEYDTNTANPWVPYPVSYDALKTLALDSGFSTLVKIGEEPSLYRRAMIYAAMMSVSV